MPNKYYLRIEVDPDEKRVFRHACEDIGLNMTVVINEFSRQFTDKILIAHDGKITFDVTQIGNVS